MNEEPETNKPEQTEPISQFSDRTIEPISTDMSSDDSAEKYSSIPTVQAKTTATKSTPETGDKLVIDTSYDGRIRPSIIVAAIILLLASTPTVSMLVGMISSIAFGGSSFAYWISTGDWFSYITCTLSVGAFASAIGLLLRYKWSLIIGVISMSVYAVINAYFLSQIMLESGLTSVMSRASQGIFLIYPSYIVIYVICIIFLLRPKVRAMFY